MTNERFVDDFHRLHPCRVITSDNEEAMVGKWVNDSVCVVWKIA